MISNLLLQLIIFFLPTQLGLHFWPLFSRAAGIRVDYLSPTLYFTDILILSYLVISSPVLIKYFRKYFNKLIIPGIFIVFNTLLSVNPLNSTFCWLRLLLYLLFFLSIRLNKITWKQIQLPLLLSTVLVVVLETLQLINQHSLGGIFYWLGERSFSLSTPGMARLTIPDQVILRPPSTFSHPNSLAGYLLVVYLLQSIHKSPSWQKIITLLGVTLTFSKAALLAYVLVLFLHVGPIVLVYASLATSLLQPIFPDILTAQFVSDRVFLLKPFFQMLTSSPLFGLGLGGFIPSLVNYLPGSFLLPEKLQPLHNLPLLVLLELGIVGLFVFYFTLKPQAKKLLNPKLLILLAIVLITGAFDHYWWTLPQNRLILVLATALLL